MAVIKDGIQVQEDNTISFGDYQTTVKQKVDGFLFEGNSYSLRTYNEATRLEKNDEFLIETNPGTAIHNFYKKEKDEVVFVAEGYKSTNITVQLTAETLYRITAGKTKLGSMKSNSAGKLKFSVDLSNGKPLEILIESLES
ncbi:MAG: endosialidase [Defluviitaleaceae bacterium]|nr:endosialidase [Defluviitaleaceae bacterium]